MRKFAFVAFCLIAGVVLTEASMPSPEFVGQVMGYPPSELLIEDNTLQERIVINSRSVRDQRRKTALPEPAALLKAFIIRGKHKDTFFPVQVYIGSKGTFLTSEVLAEIAKSNERPEPLGVGGTEFATIGRGGGFFTQHFKVKADTDPMNLPYLVAAMVAVVQPHGKDFDVMITIRLDMDLQPIAGGEVYFNNFGEYDDKKGKQRLGYAQIFLELNKIVIAEWLAEEGAGSGSAPSQPVPPEQSVPSGLPSRPDPPATPASDAWVWWSGGLLLSLLAFVIHALRKRRS